MKCVSGKISGLEASRITLIHGSPVRWQSHPTGFHVVAWRIAGKGQGRVNLIQGGGEQRAP